MKQFLKKIQSFFLIGCIPLFVLAIGYWHYDPFKVLKTYTDYSNSYVGINRDYISTTVFLKNKDKYKYNSYIFGSSRTYAYRLKSWTNYLPKNANPFVFDASGESIFGIYKKLKLIDSLDLKIDNALLILCRNQSFEFVGNHEGVIFMKHPLLTGENKINFQLQFFKAYLNPKFLFCFYDYTFSRKYKNFMKGYIVTKKIKYDTITNQEFDTDLEFEINNNPKKYYTKNKAIFYKRFGEKKDSIPRIKPKHFFMLKEIKRILNKNKSDYRVVLSPLYEQIKFNDTDLYLLKKIFGKNLYDFSGKNKFNEDIHNFYESSHYRPNVGDSILAKIYK
jgi:hypothetical protein